MARKVVVNQKEQGIKNASKSCRAAFEKIPVFLKGKIIGVKEIHIVRIEKCVEIHAKDPAFFDDIWKSINVLRAALEDIDVHKIYKSLEIIEEKISAWEKKPVKMSDILIGS